MNVIAAAILFMAAGVVNATTFTISTGSSGLLNNTSYSYLFEVSQTSETTFSAQLFNTSLSSEPVIDMFAFNLQSGYSIVFDDITPLWEFDVTTNNAEFMFIGNSITPSSRLAQYEFLSFDVIFDRVVNNSVWYDPDSTLSDDDVVFGQVAVGFQTLGIDGECNVLLTSIPTNSVPNSPTLLLFSLGLFTLYLIRSRA